MGGFIEELEIYDQQLVLMETKELNKLLKKRGVPKRKQKDIKQRRRTLKNRSVHFNLSMTLCCEGGGVVHVTSARRVLPHKYSKSGKRA